MYLQKGLEIKFCEDIKSYKKIVPALKEFPKDIIVTADDDILYPFEWLEVLYKSYLKNPDYIHCHRAHFIPLKNKTEFYPYIESLFEIDCEEPSHNIFFTSGGGVLFPPRSLHEDTVYKDRFFELSPTADDIWLNAMAVKKGTQKRIVKNRFKLLYEESFFSNMVIAKNVQEEGLCNINILENDKQLKKVHDFYRLYDVLYDYLTKDQIFFLYNEFVRKKNRELDLMRNDRWFKLGGKSNLEKLVFIIKHAFKSLVKKRLV